MSHPMHFKTRAPQPRRSPLASFALALALTAAMAGAVLAKDLRFGTPFVNGSNLHRGMEKFAEIVNAQSDRKSVV